MSQNQTEIALRGVIVPRVGRCSLCAVQTDKAGVDVPGLARLTFLVAVVLAVQAVSLLLVVS